MADIEPETPLVSQADMAILLGRSLTTLETANYSLYLSIATERLEKLVCFSFIKEDDTVRTFMPRTDYHTLYVDPFTNITSVSIDGNTIDSEDYAPKLWDRYTSTWYNSIVFDDMMANKNIVVTADWGFDEVPSDLRLLLAKLFALNSTEQTADNRVKSKKIEDFTVTYGDTPTYEQLVSDNQATISKYSLCNVGVVSHGTIRPIC